MKNKIAILSMLLYLLFLYACAQTGILTGGEKDTTPPKMLGSNPVNKSKNFEGNKITIGFNEFFELNNIQDEFISSPPLQKIPEFVIRRKKLIVKIKDQLKDSTTYRFYFGNAIQDFHERNTATGFEFVFSTGNTIDTMEIAGRLANAQTLLPEAGVLVMLYENFADSLPFLHKPDYICKTDTAGLFKLDYVKPGKYKIFALHDANSDLIFNMPQEKIAFLDSLLVPKVSATTTKDSLLAGTITYNIKTGDAIDTLAHDSVFITRKVTYTPNNLKLFLYPEDRKPQFVTSYERSERVLCKLIFNKPQKQFTFESLNTTKKDAFIIDASQNNDSVNVWVANKKLLASDTLQLKISYQNKDSLGNFITDIDTLSFVFSNPKKEKERGFRKNKKKVTQTNDSLKITYAYIKMAKQMLDIGYDFSMVSKYPIVDIDTLKIKLFLVNDTMVKDTKEQKLLLYQRTDANKFVFIFARPLVENLRLQPLNFLPKNTWYKTNYSANRDSIQCTLLVDNLIQKDSLRILVHYDNAFFRQEVQNFKDTLWLVPRSLKINDILRKSPDTLLISFNKPIGNKYQIGTKENGFSTSDFKILNLEFDNVAKIYISNHKLADTDLLNITLKAYDQTDQTGNKIFYTDTLQAIYNRVDTRLLKAKRFQKNKIFMVFNQPITKDIKLKPENFSPIGNWYYQEYSNKNDTLQITITNNAVKNLDSLKFSVSYPFINKAKKDTSATKKLTLGISKIKKIRKLRQKVNPKLSKVWIKSLTKSSFYRDSVHQKLFFVKTNWAEGQQYEIRMDSMAFTNMFGNYNTELSKTIIVKKEENYGKINIDISDIGKLENPAAFYNEAQTDTSNIQNYEKLKTGQAILQLMDTKENVLREINVLKDTTTVFKNVPEGKYLIRMFYDKNKNKKYDFGDYLTHKQPETTLYFPGTVEVKVKWKINLQWKVEYKERKIEPKKGSSKKKDS